MARTQPTLTSPSQRVVTPAQQTLIDHLHELRSRLFWIVLVLIIASSAGYLIQDQIMAALMHPLGGQRLVYLTPIGGFNFIFKVSLYFGLGVILPVIIYHLYRFLEPLMDKPRKRSVISYSIASTALAIAGASFAYFASLPAAMHFLTGFDIQNVSAMLTVDSYLAFVITYVLGFAALFQIPLILMIINTIKPIPPKKLLGFERFVVLGAFIVAAIISPTPDITNQAILAVPIILMYQIGVFCVWVQSRAARRHQPAAAPIAQQAPQPILRRAPQPQPARTQRLAAPVAQAAQQPQPIALQPNATTVTPQQPKPAHRPMVMDVAAPRRASQPSRPIRAPERRVARPATFQSRPLPRTSASIDGMIRRPQQFQAS